MKSYTDYLIHCKIHNKEEIYKINFSSMITIKEIKENIFLNYIKNDNPEDILIRLYYNLKELKPDNLMLGNINNEKVCELEFTMVALTLTEEMKNDNMKINEAIITNFAKNCEIHLEEKCVLMCLTCSHCICEKCRVKDHHQHESMKKSEILKMEENLKINYNYLTERFKNLGIDGNYNDIYINFKNQMKKQSDEIADKVDDIKKKEVKLYNSFKISFDQIFPFLLDYKDKMEKINSTYDNNKEVILKNDKDFINFYHLIINVNSLREITNENLIILKEKLEKL